MSCVLGIVLVYIYQCADTYVLILMYVVSRHSVSIILHDYICRVSCIVLLYSVCVCTQCVHNCLCICHTLFKHTLFEHTLYVMTYTIQM